MNLAARIQSKAPQGMVYISQSTFDLVRSSVGAVKMRPTVMKGVAQPVTTYSVRAFLPSRPRDTDATLRRVYLCVPVDVCGTDDDRPQRGFAHQALVAGDTLTLCVHVGRRLEPGSTITISPLMPELPGPERVLAVVKDQVSRKQQAMTFFDVKLEVREGGPLLRRLVGLELLESELDPDAIPRG